MAKAVQITRFQAKDGTLHDSERAADLHDEMKGEAVLVAAVIDDREVIAAAVLHDVVEDTPVTLDQIRAKFGERVAELVDWLTDVSRPEDGNRATRKAIDRERLARAPADAQTIKLADLIDNSATIVEHDPAFAKVYLREKADLLKVLTKGDPRLLKRAGAVLSKNAGHD